MGVLKQILQGVPCVLCLSVLAMFLLLIIADLDLIACKGECFITFPNTDKRVENTTPSGVFLTNFKVFGHVMKHSHVLSA